MILCDEWTPPQVKAFRLMVNRSVTWADWDEELLALELQELNAADFDLSLTGFDPGEIDGLLAIPDEERANAAPPLPENPVSRAGDLWLCGKHRVLCGDATRAEAVARLLGERKPILMVTDPPYGIELDSEWRDRAGLNGCGPAEASYMKHRIAGHATNRSNESHRTRSGAAFGVRSFESDSAVCRIKIRKQMESGFEPRRELRGKRGLRFQPLSSKCERARFRCAGASFRLRGRRAFRP